MISLRLQCVPAGKKKKIFYFYLIFPPYVKEKLTWNFLFCSVMFVVCIIILCWPEILKIRGYKPDLKEHFSRQNSGEHL